MPLTQAVTDIIAKHPSLSLIGNTPLVRIDLFQDELPDVEIESAAPQDTDAEDILDQGIDAFSKMFDQLDDLSDSIDDVLQ